jgi:hypothetical protein
VFVVIFIQNTNSGVCTHMKHKYLWFFLVLGDSRKDTNTGVCCESHTKHKYWCLLGQSYETQILVFILRVIRSLNTGVCYDSYIQHKYKCSKIERLLILVQLVYQWRTKGPSNPNGAWGRQTHRIMKLVCWGGGCVSFSDRSLHFRTLSVTSLTSASIYH